VGKEQENWLDLFRGYLHLLLRLITDSILCNEVVALNYKMGRNCDLEINGGKFIGSEW